MLGADVDAGRREVALRQHFLRDQRLVGERVAGSRTQKPVSAGSPVISIGSPCLRRQRLPALARSRVPVAVICSQDRTRSMTSSVFSAAVGPMRSVQNVLLMNVRLRGLHDLAPADHGGDRVAVAERLAEHRHVGLDAVELVQAAERLAEAGRAFVEDQHDAAVGREPAAPLRGNPCSGPMLRATSIMMTPIVVIADELLRARRGCCS